LVEVTGATAITSIGLGYQPGRVMVLKFTSTADLIDGSNLKLAGSFTDDTAGRTIQLACDGTNCHEISRSVN